MNYIDLFAGASGMSEGFVRAGCFPLAHVEMNSQACFTIQTRSAYHYLKSKGDLTAYYNYLSGIITRDSLYKLIPSKILASIINEEISYKTLPSIFSRIDDLRNSEKVDIIIGGPPCQAYSLVGRSRDPNRMKRDRRNYLFRFYAEFLRYYKPRYFVFENVLGLLSAGNRRYLIQMLDLFDELGYSTDLTVLNAEDYGVLQKRRRVIIVGRKGNQKFRFPVIEKLQNTWEIKKDLFYDLPNLKPGEELPVAKYKRPANEYLKMSGIRNGIDFVTLNFARNHNVRDLEIYEIAIRQWVHTHTRLKYNDLPNRLQTHHKTRIFLDRFKVVDPGGHSHTLVAHISKDGHHYIYPDENQIRSISVREAARIQSFPDDYFFEGGRTSAFNQIGNAVPPLMAEAIAKEIIKLG